jgi:putative transposase
MADRRDTYPTDLSDAEWAVLEPLLPPPARTGRPRKWPRRLMAEAIFYLVRSGCPWRMLPREYPPWRSVYSQLARWRRDGTLRRAHDGLRAMTRETVGRDAEPSAGILDSQTTRSTGVGGPARGYDSAKRAAGRTRHVMVDTLGLVLLAHVHVADLRDGLGARELVGRMGALNTRSPGTSLKTCSTHWPSGIPAALGQPPDARDRHALTPLIWEHVDPYGCFESDMSSRISALT